MTDVMPGGAPLPPGDPLNGIARGIGWNLKAPKKRPIRTKAERFYFGLRQLTVSQVKARRRRTPAPAELTSELTIP